MYQIMIEQDRSFMSDEPANYMYRLEDITEVRALKNNGSQIGKFPKCAICGNIMFMPSGLTITPFITDESKLLYIADFLLTIRKRQEIKIMCFLSKEYGGGKQTIRIEKVN